MTSYRTSQLRADQSPSSPVVRQLLHDSLLDVICIPLGGSGLHDGAAPRDDRFRALSVGLAADHKETTLLIPPYFRRALLVCLCHACTHTRSLFAHPLARSAAVSRVCQRGTKKLKSKSSRVSCTGQQKTARSAEDEAMQQIIMRSSMLQSKVRSIPSNNVIDTSMLDFVGVVLEMILLDCVCNFTVEEGRCIQRECRMSEAQRQRITHSIHLPTADDFQHTCVQTLPLFFSSYHVLVQDRVPFPFRFSHWFAHSYLHCSSPYGPNF